MSKIEFPQILEALEELDTPENLDIVSYQIEKIRLYFQVLVKTIDPTEFSSLLLKIKGLKNFERQSVQNYLQKGFALQSQLILEELEQWFSDYSIQKPKIDDFGTWEARRRFPHSKFIEGLAYSKKQKNTV